MVQELKYTPDKITSLEPHQIMVFGSNVRGVHGNGAAKDALAFGAIMGRGFGLFGQTYALPTKLTPQKSMDITVKTDTIYGPLSVSEVVTLFIEDTHNFPDLEFLVTKVGCGYAGYTPEQIAPLFREALELKNVVLPREFHEVLNP